MSRPASSTKAAAGSAPGSVQRLVCVSCGTAYPAGDLYMCAACGLDGILEVEYDYAAIARTLSRRVLAGRSGHSHWRYRELLPVGDHAMLPPLSVGWTPVTLAESLGAHLGLQRLYLKDDGRNPTGSLKDRASALAVVRAREEGCKTIACASTGNAASSLAGMAASMGLESVIFVPQQIPEPKLTQLLIFGATVLRVQGSYHDAFLLCQTTCEKEGWYNRNCAINPWLIEGKKTAGLEICEQLGWEVPDWVAVSVGDGCTIAGIWKGFREMMTLGLTAKAPKMLGVQAEGAAPLTRAFLGGVPPRPIDHPRTLADSISVGYPRNWKKALTAIAQSGGAMLNVSDEEILEAMAYTGRLAGIFAEPAAATAVAGLRRAVSERIIPRVANALAVITGNGLKDTSSARLTIPRPFDVAPDGSGLDEILQKRKEERSI